MRADDIDAPGRVLVWFSCGAASAVAAKLAVAKYGDRAEVIYCDTSGDEHPDNLRFLSECEVWIKRPIVRIRSPLYAGVEDVFARTRYMSGVAGARCTVELKKAPRLAYQRPDDTHVFGYTSDEVRRAAAFESANPTTWVEWVLIDAGIDKAACHAMVAAAGIAAPAMYGLGFSHNNCIGCVKATSPGYWDRVRRLFPETFARRAAQSRALGVRLARVNGERVFLDQVPVGAGEPDDPGIDCGPACQLSFNWLSDDG